MKKRGFRFTFNMALFLILAALFATIALMNPVFLSFDYLVGVMLRNIAEIGMMALTMTLIVVTGGIDLSVGSTMVLSSMLGRHGGAEVRRRGGPGGDDACGRGVRPFQRVSDRAGEDLAAGHDAGHDVSVHGRGAQPLHGDSVYAYDLSQWLGTEDLSGVPVQILIYAALALLFWFLLHRTSLGRKLFGIGLNENATRFCGIDTARVKMRIYLFSGLVCAFAG